MCTRTIQLVAVVVVVVVVVVCKDKNDELVMLLLLLLLWMSSTRRRRRRRLLVCRETEREREPLLPCCPFGTEKEGFVVVALFLRVASNATVV